MALVTPLRDGMNLVGIVELFGRARAITDASPGSTTFDSLVWYVLNSRVRPFTAKWHAKSAAGALRALDSSDEFRAALAGVQSVLIELDQVLQVIKVQPGYVVFKEERPDRGAIDAEMSVSANRRPMGVKSGDFPSSARKTGCGTHRRIASGSASPNCRVLERLSTDVELKHFAHAERTAVMERRTKYGLDRGRPWAAGLALSGGGIRSATFSMGVMVSLAKRNLMHQFDYLSTVSGGG